MILRQAQDKRGRFVTLEGGEGVGKSTQLQALAEALCGRGLDVLTTREPGGSPGGEAIRALLLQGEAGRWSPRTETLLFAAARLDHWEATIAPALDAGRWVISDRYLDSTRAYQGASGVADPDILALHRLGGAGLPDRTLILTLPDGVERARARDGSEQDRIGGRDAAYHARVAASFVSFTADEPERCRMIDADGAREAVTARLLEALADWLP